MSDPSMPSSGGDPAKAMEPRDAATLVIVDRVKGVPRVLMGQRRLDQVFMPGKFVFPGGRVDLGDGTTESADELRPIELAKLLLDMKGTPSQIRARALAMAAIRETFEEAGVIIGAPAEPPPKPVDIPGWGDFFACGYRPKLSSLAMFARAITPPGRPRRYDTRFFYISADEISHQIEISDGELSKLHWLTIEEARSLDLPSITRRILVDLMDFLRDGIAGQGEAPIPYYYHENGTFRRELLSVTGSVAGASLQLDTRGHGGIVRPNTV